MAKISTIDIRLLEEVFSSEKGRGYVLDFSDRTFSQFFREELHINIDDQKYSQDGSSKGKRLRKFLQIEQEPLVARALRALWNYRQTVNGSFDTKDEKAKQRETRFFQLVHAMDGKGGLVRQDAGEPFSGTVNPSQHALTELNDRLLKLVALKVQDRGFAFEGFLSDLFALYEIAPRRSFRNTGEQIDGSFELPPETFLRKRSGRTPKSAKRICSHFRVRWRARLNGREVYSLATADLVTTACGRSHLAGGQVSSVWTGLTSRTSCLEG